jgi:hypothetical protein
MSLTARGFLGAGSLQFSLIVNGIAQGYGSARETSKFEIKPSSDIKNLESKAAATYGQVIESVAIPKPADVSISLREADYENLILSFMGSDGVGANQAAATVADEVVVLKIGKYTELSKRNLQSTGFVLTNTDATTTYTLGTDYEVIYLTGQIRAIAGGAITELQSCKVDFVANAFTSKKIMGATQTSIRAKILFTGKNMADQTPVLVTVWEGVFTPDSAFDLLANDFGDVTLKGQLKTPVGKTSPFEVDFLDLA